MGAGPRPRYGRWTYWEKFDYFAVFWGIFVIGSTGLMLWFPVFFTRLLPGWLINVATIIHSDEALLATGFIFTVHFFNTHLRPEKFPMDIVVFTGRMPLVEFKRDKPAEYEALVASGQLEENLVWPYQPVVIRTFRVFAWTALGLGHLPGAPGSSTRWCSPTGRPKRARTLCGQCARGVLAAGADSRSSRRSPTAVLDYFRLSR